MTNCRNLWLLCCLRLWPGRRRWIVRRVNTVGLVVYSFQVSKWPMIGLWSTLEMFSQSVHYTGDWWFCYRHLEQWTMLYYYLVKIAWHNNEDLSYTPGFIVRVLSFRRHVQSLAVLPSGQPPTPPSEPQTLRLTLAPWAEICHVCPCSSVPKR